MPPRVRFTPDRILDGALALLRREGLDALTARTRAVAETLGA